MGKKKSREPEQPTPTIEVGKIDLFCFMALVNCATFGSAIVTIPMEKQNEKQMYDLYRQAEKAMMMIDPERWTTMMYSLLALGTHALEAAQITGIKPHMENFEKPGAGDPNIN